MHGSYVENKPMVTRVKGRGVNWEMRLDIYTPLYRKCVSNKDLLCSTGNRILKKMDICITDSFCYTPETNTTL